VIRLNIAVFAILFVACISSMTYAQNVQPAVYQRVSTQATIARTNWAQHGGHWGGGNWGWGYPGPYNPWFAPQVFSGTWYERPYPDHLIFNNVRSQMMATPAACGLAIEAGGTVEVTPER
jgi:hypothetical protein